MAAIERPLAIHIRVSAKEQEAFRAAADKAGLNVSAWTRMILREAVYAKKDQLRPDVIAGLTE